MTEKHLTIAYRLLKCRDAARKFYGAGWRQKQSEWKPIIEAVMAQHKCELLNAAIILGKQLEGFSLMTCLGVVMEMLEQEEK